MNRTQQEINTSRSMDDKEFDILMNKSTTWKCDYFFDERALLPAAGDGDADANSRSSSIVNLSVDYFAKQKSYLFTDSIIGEEHKDCLIQALKKASLRCGFTLVIRSSQSGRSKKLQKSKFGVDITLACQHHQPYFKNRIIHCPTTEDQETQKSRNIRKTSTIRPSSKEYACNFTFHLRMYKAEHHDHGGRWIIVPGKKNDGSHRGHWCVESHLLKTPVKLMDKGERELANQCADINIATTASTALLNKRNKDNIGTFSDNQVRYVISQHQKSSKNVSSAQKILDEFDQMENAAYLTVTYNPRDALMLSMSNKQRKANITPSEDETQKLVALYNASVVNGGNLLLIVLFATAEELWRFRMNPHYCCADTTSFGTNNEKKELFTLASTDGNNKAFNCGRAFVPSSQAWVFHLLFKYCLPIFWGDDVCQNLRLLITDGCVQEYTSFLQNIGPNSAFPNACHGLCNFHLLILGYNKHVRGLLSNDSNARKTVLAFVSQWGYAVETKEEYELSKNRFIEWIDSKRQEKSKEFPPHAVDAVKFWVKNHLEPYEKMWVNYHRLQVRGLSMRTTSVGEAMHASAKTGFDKVTASMSPAKSAKTMMDKASKLGNESAKRNFEQLNKTQLYNHDSETAKHLTIYCEKITSNQWELSKTYKVLRISENLFLVWNWKPLVPPENGPQEEFRAVPTFLRTRKVEVVGKKFMNCSCGMPARNMFPCRHIFAVLKKRHKKMYSNRWLKTYCHTFGKDRERGIPKGWSDYFRKREAEEKSRDFESGEHILVEGLLDTVMSVPVDSGSDLVPLRVSYWTEKMRPIVRDKEIPPIPGVEEAEEDEFVAPNDDEQDGIPTINFCSQEDGMDYEMKLPENLVQLRNDEHTFRLTQESQKEAMKIIENLHETKEQSIVAEARELLKVHTSVPSRSSAGVSAILQALTNLSRRSDIHDDDFYDVADMINNWSGHRNTPRGNKRPLPTDETALETVPTGMALKKKETRTKYFWE